MSAILTREYDIVRGPLTSSTELFEFKRSRNDAGRIDANVRV